MNAIADEDTIVVNRGKFTPKQLIAAAIFAPLATALAMAVPSIEIAWVMGVLMLTIYLFAFEVVGVDVAAVTVMVLLGLSTLLAPVMGLNQGLVDIEHLFDGFSSNAVMSIIAVMIIGAGLDKTGLMTKVAAFILQIGGTSERRIIPIISSTVGFISSFMQNVGAAALFLLFAVILLRMLRAAKLARDTFGRLLCTGIAAWFFFQIVVNVGMNLQLVPVTGLPLPFISYGGSSLVPMLAAMGLVQSVLLRHRKIEF
jgi:cell division protein FtsW (lipid II flippase)